MEQELETPVAGVLEISSVQTPQDIAPRLVGRVGIPMEEAVPMIRAGLERYIHGIEERASLDVRPGVTLCEDHFGFPVIEVCLTDRVYGVSTGRLQKILENGTFDVFCQGLLEKLRSKLRNLPQTGHIIYRRVDLLREILHELESIWPLGTPSATPGLREGTAAYYKEQVNLIKAEILKALQPHEDDRVETARNVPHLSQGASEVRDAHNVRVEGSTPSPATNILERSIRTLDFPNSNWGKNALAQNGIKTIGDLVSKTETELRNIRGFGISSFRRVKDALAAMGLSLAPEAE